MRSVPHVCMCDMCVLTAPAIVPHTYGMRTCTCVHAAACAQFCCPCYLLLVTRVSVTGVCHASDRRRQEAARRHAAACIRASAQGGEGLHISKGHIGGWLLACLGSSVWVNGRSHMCQHQPLQLCLDRVQHAPRPRPLSYPLRPLSCCPTPCTYMLRCAMQS